MFYIIYFMKLFRYRLINLQRLRVDFQPAPIIITERKIKIIVFDTDVYLFYYLRR